MEKKILKSVKSKFIAPSIVALASVLLVFLVTYPLVLKMFAKEIEQNTGERMQNAILRLDDNLNNIQQQVLSLNNSSNFRDIFSKRELSDYDTLKIWKQSMQILRENPYIDDFCIISRDNTDAITGSGVQPADSYFSRYWYNQEYNTGFWKRELLKPFFIRYYPQTEYISNTFDSKNESKTVMPMAFKNFLLDKKYMIVLFVDLQAMCQDIDPYILEHLLIYDQGVPLLQMDDTGVADYEPYLNGRDMAFEQIGADYAVICRSRANDFIYVKNTPVSEVSGSLSRIYVVSGAIVFAALLFSLGLAAVIARKVSKPFSDITKILKENQLVNEKGVDELFFLEDNLQNILGEKKQIAEELEQKNVMLSSFLYQSKLKNIYMNIESSEINEASSQHMRYYLIGFQVYYQEDVCKILHRSYNELSYILKEHIQNVLKSFFPSLLLFQPEENSFFAKAGMLEHGISIEDVMEKILNRLANEEEYCHFLIAVSRQVEDEVQITEHYYRVMELLQCFRLETCSQILYEDEVPARNFTDLSSQQEAGLKKLILAGDTEGTRQFLKKLLADGLSPRTTILGATLFCNSLIRIMMKTLTEKYGYFPLELSIQSVYNRIQKSHSESQFSAVIFDFAEQAAGYVSENSQVEDPLIAGVNAYVGNHYKEEFTMEMMAEELKISKSYLSTCFKSKTGMNLVDFIQQYRINKATQLIKSQNVTFSEIGSQVGINNSNTFIRVFKKQTGMTPSEYRKNCNLESGGAH